MKIVILNPPHPSIGSRMAGEHLPPLGLLSIAGPLIDAGNEVHLLDADEVNMSLDVIAMHVKSHQPEVLMVGHSGSSTIQPLVNRIARRLKMLMPTLTIILGGVYPTYAYEKILHNNLAIDCIVRGEGEQIALDLINALENKVELSHVKGIAFRNENKIIATPEAPLIHNLDDYRIAWELMEGHHYTYWGKRKAVVMQFSRGCRHKCSYCGQTRFWKQWRSRSPLSMVDELEMLRNKLGVEVINFADESPAADQDLWLEFLRLLIERNLGLVLVGSIRADQIVRDAEYLHLYKKAGFERFLMGIENYRESVLKKLNKQASLHSDRKAIQLLQEHNILAMVTFVIGFGNERLRDIVFNFKMLRSYDPDQIQLLYAVPHPWTPYCHEVENSRVVDSDTSKWDYKHQILEMAHFKPWQLILVAKLFEVLMQTRPKVLYRRVFHKDKALRKAMAWYNTIGKRVWFYELKEFFKTTRKGGMLVREVL